MMTRVLFICSDSICNSPMAKPVMKELAKKVGLENKSHAEFAASRAEET